MSGTDPLDAALTVLADAGLITGGGTPPDQLGPCAKCRQPCRRYGDGANPLCSTCRTNRGAKP